MPTTDATGFETYIYDHKQHIGSNEDTRQYLGRLHDPAKLPDPKAIGDDAPLFMIEPSYATGSTDVFIMGKGHVLRLSRAIAEQLRDALIKVCQKP